MATIPDLSNREVIIGAGVHAAIYAATRVSLGYPKPVVIEKSSFSGGIFSQMNMGFWLNSANRNSLSAILTGPSLIKADSVRDELNFLPNCNFQISDYSQTEYPSNRQVATVIGYNIARYADTYRNSLANVMPGSRTINIGPSDEPGNYDTYECGRIIDARGVMMRRGEYDKSRRIMTAVKFATSGWNGELATEKIARIAIIGSEDTGCIIAEHLLGMGPVIPNFTSLRRIDWYSSSSNFPLTKKQWARDRHARYISLARHFPQAGITGMINPIRERGLPIDLGDSVQVNGRNYDLAIICTGFIPGSFYDYYIQDYSQRPYGRAIGFNQYAIGAMAKGPFTQEEIDRGYGRFPRNSISIFRLGRKTAALAQELPPL